MYTNRINNDQTCDKGLKTVYFILRWALWPQILIIVMYYAWINFRFSWLFHSSYDFISYGLKVENMVALKRLNFWRNWLCLRILGQDCILIISVLVGSEQCAKANLFEQQWKNNECHHWLQQKYRMHVHFRNNF